MVGIILDKMGKDGFFLEFIFMCRFLKGGVEVGVEVWGI